MVESLWGEQVQHRPQSKGYTLNSRLPRGNACGFSSLFTKADRCRWPLPGKPDKIARLRKPAARLAGRSSNFPL
jgi:hypothetical protein